MHDLKTLNDIANNLKLDDYWGNKVYVSGFTVYLHLAKKDSTRDIGRLCLSGKGNIVYAKRGLVEREHVFRKNNSWGVHLGVLEALPDHVVVNLVSDIASYYLTVEEIISLGSYMHFLPQGFEKQIFVEKKHWNVL